MAERSLHGCRVLVAEDEYMLAYELQTELQDAGVLVIGPVAGLADATDLILSCSDIDCAILDANLGGEMIFSAADLLIERGVPIVFTTGYDASGIPHRFSASVRCEKPFDINRIMQAIGQAIHA